MSGDSRGPVMPGAVLGMGAALPAADFDVHRRGGVERDLVYARPGGVPVAMDLHFPKTGGPWPCVVMIHGGGWSEGDKAGFDLGMARHGFLVATINYRLAPSFRFPAMIEDVKGAIRFLRAHAAEYNLDPGRMALLGHSAGGHLAALAALAGKEAGWDVGGNLDHSSEVQAVVELSGPADMKLRFAADGPEGLGYTAFDPGQWETASPITWARADAPPFLVIHGKADGVVSIEQARILVEALRRAGATADFVPVSHAGHGFESIGGLAWPPIPFLFFKALRFLKRNLR